MVHSRSPRCPPYCNPPRLQVLGEELLGREREVAVLRAELAEELARAKQDGAAAVAERAKLQVARAVAQRRKCSAGSTACMDSVHIVSVSLGETCVLAWVAASLLPDHATHAPLVSLLAPCPQAASEDLAKQQAALENARNNLAADVQRNLRVRVEGWWWRRLCALGVRRTAWCSQAEGTLWRELRR